MVVEKRYIVVDEDTKEVVSQYDDVECGRKSAIQHSRGFKTMGVYESVVDGCVARWSKKVSYYNKERELHRAARA